MSKTKFDLNKALQTAQLYIPIDYDSIPINTEMSKSSYQKTMDDFNNTLDNIKNETSWVGAGAKQRKEEQEKRDSLPWHSKLGYYLLATPQDNASVPLYTRSASDRLMVGDYAGAESIQKPIDTISGIASGVGALGAFGLSGLFGAAATYGWPAALAAEAVSTGTGITGYQAFNKLGRYIDNKKGTNVAPYLSFLAALVQVWQVMV